MVGGGALAVQYSRGQYSPVQCKYSVQGLPISESCAGPGQPADGFLEEDEEKGKGGRTQRGKRVSGIYLLL